jgi:hypothetical protein
MTLTATYDKAELLGVLTLLKVTSAGAKSTLTSLTHVYFDKVWAFSYDGQHLSRVPFPSDLALSAPLATLLALTNTAKGKTITATQSSEGTVEWRGGRSRGAWDTLNPKEWPVHMEVFSEFAEETSVDNQSLATAIRAVIPCVSEVASPDDHVRTPGILLKVNSKRVFACATDNTRAGMAFRTGVFVKQDPIIVPSSFSKILKSAPPDGLQFYQSDNWAGLRFAEGYEVFTRLIAMVEGADYGYGILSKVATPQHKIVVDDAFMEAVKAISDLGKAVQLTITCNNGLVELCGRCKEPNIELDLPGGAMTLADGAEASAAPDACYTVVASHLLRLLSPDSSIYFAEFCHNDIVLVDAHGANFVVSTITEHKTKQVESEES